MGRRVTKNLKKYWQLYSMLIIPLTFVIVFSYMSYPGIRIAFMNYRPAKGWDSEWVGFKMFMKAFSDRDFWRAIKNTFIFNIMDIAAGFPAPIILALLLNELRLQKFKRVAQTVLYMPHFLSSVIVASIAYTLFKQETGIVNIVLKELGLITEGIPFLTENVNWAISYILIGVWQGMGWGSIIYLASMASISPELYEAATVDGATRFQKMRHITIPGIKPTIVMLLIMRLGSLLASGFERLSAFGNVNVREVQYQLAIYTFEKGLRNGQFSQATAVGLFTTLVSISLILISDKIAKKLGEDGLI